MATWRDALTEAETERLSELRLERDRRDYLAAHVLLRLALAEARNLDPATIDTTRRAGWSIAHSHGFAACAIAANASDEVGIDTEPLGAANRLHEISEVFLAAAERAALPNEPQDRAAHMVEIWTAKEALLKARGEGFSGEEGFGILSRLECAPLGILDGWATISLRDARDGAAYTVWRRWVGSHALAVVALEGNEGEPGLMGVSLT